MQNNITKRLKGRVKQEFQGGDASTVNTILKVQLANKEEYIRNQDVVINLLTYLLLRYEMCVGDRDHKITCLKHTQAQALLTAPDSKDSESPHFAYRPKAVSIQAKATSSPVNAQNNGGGPTHSPVTMQDPASDKPDSDMDIDPSDEEEEMEVDSSASHVRERKRPHSSSSNSQPSNAVAAKACPSDNTAIMVSVSSRPSNRVRVHELEEEMCLSRVNFERLTGLVFALHREWQREYGKRKAVDKREKEAREQHTKTAKKWTSELTKCAKIQKKYSHLKKEAITSEKRYINKLISEKKSTDEAKLKGYSNFTERQKLQQELDESKETTELMRGRTISLEQELRDLGEKFDSQEIYKNGLQGELEQVTQTKIDLKDVLKRERQEITSIRKENTTLFRTLTQTNGTLSALQGTKQRNEELERKYAKLQKEFERMSMNNKNMSSKLESVSRENQQFSDRLIFVEANAVNSKVQLDKLMQLSSATESELRRQLADQSKTGREAQEEAEGLRARLRELEGVDGKFAEHKTQATEVEKRLQKEIEQNRQLNLLERERNDLAVQSMDAQVQATQRIIAEEKRAHKEKMRRQALQQYDDVRVKLERTHQRVAEREEESQKEKDALEQKIAQHMEQAELFKKKCESQIAATSKMYVKCQLCGKKSAFDVPCGLTDDDCFELECGRCKNITSQYGGNRNSDSENDEEPASAGDLDQASTQGDDNIIIAEMISSDTADGSSQGKPEPSGPSIDDNCSTAVSSSSKPKPEASTSSSSSMQDAEKFTTDGHVATSNSDVSSQITQLERALVGKDLELSALREQNSRCESELSELRQQLQEAVPAKKQQLLEAAPSEKQQLPEAAVVSVDLANLQSEVCQLREQLSLSENTNKLLQENLSGAETRLKSIMATPTKQLSPGAVGELSEPAAAVASQTATPSQTAAQSQEEAGTASQSASASSPRLRIRKLTDELVEMRMDCTTARGRILELESELSDCLNDKSRISELEGSVASLTGSLEEERANYEDSEKMVAQLENDYAKLQESAAAQLKQYTEDFEQQLATATEQREKLSELCEEQRQSLTEVRETLTKHLSTSEEERGQLAEQLSVSLEERNQLSVEAAKQRAQLRAQLEEQRRASKSSMYELRSANMSWCGKLAQLEEQLTEASSSKHELEQQLAESTSSKHEMEQQLAESSSSWQESQQQLQDQLARSVSDLKAAELRLHTIESEVSELRQSKEAASREKDDALKRCDELRLKVESLEAAAAGRSEMEAVAANEKLQLEAVVQQLTASKEQLQQTISDTEATNAKLESDLLVARSALSQAGDRITELNEEISLLDESARAKLTQIMSRTTRAESQLNDIQKALSQKEAGCQKALSEKEAECQKALAQKEACCQKALSEEEAECQKIIDETEATWQNVISEMEADFQSEMSEKQAECQKLLSDMETGCQKSLLEKDEACQKLISEMESGCKKSVSEKETECQKLVSEREAECQKLLSEKEDCCQKSVSDKEAECQKALSETEVRCQMKTEEMLQHWSARVEAQKNYSATFEAQVIELRSKIEIRDRIIKNIESARMDSTLNGTIAIRDRTITAFEYEVCRLEGELATAVANVQTLETEKSESETRFEQLQSELSETQSKLEAVQEEYELHKSKSSLEMDALRSNIRECEVTSGEMEAKLFRDGKNMLDDLKVQLEKSEDRCVDFANKLEESQNQFIQSDTRAKKAELELAEVRTKLTESVKRADEAKAKLNQSQNAAALIDIQLKEFEVQSTEAARNLTEAENQANETAAKLEKAEMNAQEATDKLTETTAMLREAENRSDETNRKLTETADKLTETTIKLKEAESRAAKITAKLIETADQLAETGDMLGVANGQISEIFDTLTETTAKLKKAESQATETTAKLTETTAKLTE
eukprot:51927_1